MRFAFSENAMAAQLLVKVALSAGHHAALLKAARDLPDDWTVSVEPEDARLPDGRPLGLRLKLNGPCKVVGMRLLLGHKTSAEISGELLAEVGRARR
jgi:hypothetical protein